jgi:hypothetical protein
MGQYCSCPKQYNYDSPLNNSQVSYYHKIGKNNECIFIIKSKPKYNKLIKNNDIN